MLIILDGWGLNHDSSRSAIEVANTPFMDALMEKYPNSTLVTHGELVGLPDGQMGNSEVGHMNLGAGRIINQDLQMINIAIAKMELGHNETILEAVNYAKANHKNIHLLGLISDGGIHSHYNHTKALTTVFKDHQFSNVFVHAFTDGRDTDPRSGVRFVKDLDQHLQQTVGSIASVTGRYYAMDRDTRWDRTAKAYHALVHGTGERTTDIFGLMDQKYENGETDEFILPIVRVDEAGNPVAVIRPGDVVIFTNFRSDRARQLCNALIKRDHPVHDMQAMNLHFVSFKRYDEDLKEIKPVFETKFARNTMGEVLANAGKKQLRIAETEKYPHVTYFFNNGREDPYPGEDRIMVPSPRDVATYDLKPEMSAYEVTTRLVDHLDKKESDFVCLNFANPDMVGHTGVFEAAVKACEVVDECTQRVVEKALDQNFSVIIIADHGNADYMRNDDGSPNTNHSMFPVPCILVSNNADYKIKSGKLGDIAPTLLYLMNIPVPDEMTGENLVLT